MKEKLKCSINDGNILEHPNVQIKDKSKYYGMESIMGGGRSENSCLVHGLKICSQLQYIQFVEKWICEASFPNENRKKKKTELVDRSIKFK